MPSLSLSGSGNHQSPVAILVLGLERAAILPVVQTVRVIVDLGQPFVLEAIDVFLANSNTLVHGIDDAVLVRVPSVRVEARCYAHAAEYAPVRGTDAREHTHAAADVHRQRHHWPRGS